MEEARMSFYCSVCQVNWAPKQTRAGACVLCGGGTRRVQVPMSEQAPHLHLLALMAEADAQREAQRLEEVRELHARFEAYYERREMSVDAWEQPTEPIDSVAVALEAAWLADAVEPRRSL
jgi:hypothetical protein